MSFRAVFLVELVSRETRMLVPKDVSAPEKPVFAPTCSIGYYYSLSHA